MCPPQRFILVDSIVTCFRATGFTYQVQHASCMAFVLHNHTSSCAEACTACSTAIGENRDRENLQWLVHQGAGKVVGTGSTSQRAWGICAIHGGCICVESAPSISRGCIFAAPASNPMLGIISSSELRHARSSNPSIRPSGGGGLGWGVGDSVIGQGLTW